MTITEQQEGAMMAPPPEHRPTVEDLIPIRSEAAIKAEALREAADAVVMGGSVSETELPHGSGRREISAWLHRRARAAAHAGRNSTVSASPISTQE